MKRFLLYCIIFIGCIKPSFGQEFPRPEVNLELFVQELIDQQEDDNILYEDIYENLFQFYQNPINLNNTNTDELTTLFLLSPAQIQSLLQYQLQAGKLVSIYELQAVPGFDLVTIYRLLPFVMVQDPGLLEGRKDLWQRMLTNKNHWAIMRYDRGLERRKGYTPPDTIGTRLTSRYLGSPDKYLIRYRNSHTRDFSYGFTLEKDAGERFAWNRAKNQYGADFYSAHFQLYNKGKLKALALGDYQLQFGQGLLLSSGFSIGKGSETITTIRRSNIGVRPYSSVLESGFFRGGALTYSIKPNLELTGFYSNRKVDASLQAATDTLENIDFTFSGIQVSGLHRTPTELANKHRLNEQVVGSNITQRNLFQNFTLGFTTLFTQYNIPLLRAPVAYNLHAFSGRYNLVSGLNYSYSWQNISFFGETARSSGGGLGTVNGLLVSLAKTADFSVVYRNYQKDFHSLYGNAFGENTRNNNEQGLYFGLKLKPAPHWEITAYYDQFKFPWLKYRVDAPSQGNEYLARILFRPNKKTVFYAQLRTETKGLNLKTPDRKLEFVAPATRQNYLLYLDYSPNDFLNLRSRIQASQYEHGGPKESGFYIGQEVNLSFRKTHVSTRYALFDTDDYDTRQYVTERDVLYAFSIPALSGMGSRVYMVVQQAILPQVDVWLKFAQTQYRHQHTIGSGLEEIRGNKRTDIRFQVRYQF
ncbi:ComEA family DNA-binding protein [Adhaeribacter aquaticus]|uniref:ComEA family DNA-binding protein n=1 Tax=Adhaeribacter aquaticus TaxID=299567 RepID=UPI000423B1FA|nr:helix-hairpin-helix domain-containing protein [Adhaeribacter aquaticus]